MDNYCKSQESRLKDFEKKVEEEKKKINKEKFYYDRSEKRVMYVGDVKRIEEKAFDLKPISNRKYEIQKIILIMLLLVAMIFIIINR